MICTTCHGEGYLIFRDEDPDRVLDGEVCATCGGEGAVSEAPEFDGVGCA